MTMNEKIPVPRTTEPDPLDELAKWLEVVFKVCRPGLASMANYSSLPPQPGAIRPGAVIAAEKDLLRWETIKEGQAILCRSPARCEHHRCRRRRRCTRLDVVAAGLAVARARLAAQRAGRQPPPAPAQPQPSPCEPPPRGHRKGRTGVRP
jgi:hypothetical protein